jgi:hypothetical protein
MKSTATLENVIEKVHAMSANHFDETLPLNDMEFQSADAITISGERFEVSPSAQRLLTNRLRVPGSYLHRCPAELQQSNLNYWLEQEKKKRDTFFCRFDGNKLRAVFTDRYEPIDNMEILSKMLEYGIEPYQEVCYSVNDEMLVVNVPDYDRAFWVQKRDDSIVPGISIVNSEIGLMSLSIKAFYLRLACTNGLVDRTSVDAKYRHISRKCIDDFPIVLEGVISQSRQGNNRFLISAETSVEDPINSIETFCRQFQLSQKEADVVKQAFFMEEGGTMYHIINAFTRGAQMPDLSVSVSHQMERIGGAILSMVKG